MNNLAVKYQKVKIFEDIYIYIFKEIIENVEYNFLEDYITYIEDGEEKILYEMENPYFTVSDEEYCFSDLIFKDELELDYDTTDIESQKKQYAEDMKIFFRIGIFLDKKEKLIVLNSNLNDILKAKPDSHYDGYTIDYSSESPVSMGISSIYNMINDLNEKNYDEVKKYLEEIVKVSDDLSDLVNSGDLSVDSIDDFYDILNNEESEEVKEEIDFYDKNEHGLDELQEELESLVGLENIKLLVQKLTNYLIYVKQTEGMVDLEKPNLNFVFKGNPGTGKTTIARIVAKIFYNLGYIKKDKFAETTAQDFIGGYVGQTAIKSRKMIKKNKGGAIFIDEAYVFASRAQDFAEEALVEILKEMETHETVFIFAGYEEEMMDFIKMNPGFKSRVGHFIQFKDYNFDELYQIFERKLNNSHLVATEEVKEEVKKLILENKNYEHFGNGRFIDNIFDKMIINHAHNVVQNDALNDIDCLKTITKEDMIDIDENIKSKVKKIGY